MNKFSKYYSINSMENNTKYIFNDNIKNINIINFKPIPPLEIKNEMMI